MRVCNCRMCKRNRRLAALLVSVSAETAAEIRSIYEDLSAEHEADSTELAWHKGVIDGSWPSANEIRQRWMKSWEVV